MAQSHNLLVFTIECVIEIHNDGDRIQDDIE